MQDNTFTQHPAELVRALCTVQLVDLLEEFVDRRHVGARYHEIECAAKRFGYEFRHENGNVYGRLMLVPASTALAPKFRVITRSDHAAVHGSCRVA